MLRALDITDMLLIERANLEFGPGLNVLTGETGAGKSILLDALGFVLGWRGRAELVRRGAERGEVVAEFALAPGHPAFAVLDEAGIEAEGGELLLRRINAADGRKSAWVNGARASGEVLRALSEVLVELHGQGDDRGLLDARGHRALLDDFAGLSPDLAELRRLWAARRAAAAALEAAESRLAALRAEEEFLRHAVAELGRLAPEPEEEEALDAARRRMQAAARVRDEIGRALQAVGFDGAGGLAADALKWLEASLAGAEGRLDMPVAALERAQDALAEAEQGIEAALEALDFSPAELERTEERLFALRALARKHSVAPSALPLLAEELGARLAALDASEGELGALKSALHAADAAYGAAAAGLGTKRRAAAGRLAAAMAAELPPLKLERAVFSVEVTPAEPGPDGADAVRFVAATNPGAPAGPIDKVASGGELSRFLLALKVCLVGAAASGQVMIFDEIDRGVGGATADAVGRRLAALAAGGQVLVVTHSPQVAARAAHHFRVEKRVEAGPEGEETRSLVTALAPQAREDEIARMLSGEDITEAARAAARALITG